MQPVYGWNVETYNVAKFCDIVFIFTVILRDECRDPLSIFWLFTQSNKRVTLTCMSPWQWGWTHVIPRLTFFVLAFLLVSVAIGDAFLVARLFSKGRVDSLGPIKLLRFMVP